MRTLAVLVLSLLVHSCAFSIETQGEYDNPLTGKISFGLKMDGSLGGSGEKLANRCAEIVFTDGDGNVVGTVLVQGDQNGNASAPVPDGTKFWDWAIVDCPEEEDDDEEAGDASPSAAGPFGGVAQAQEQGPTLPLAKVLVFGGPLELDVTPGAVNRNYSMEVVASTATEALALIAPIVENGVGARVSGKVNVLHFSEASVDASGGVRYRQATPGEFLSWRLFVNGGASYSDLFTNSLRYAVGSWDVVETLVPESALDLGVLPGVTYTNVGEVTYRTKSNPAPSKDRVAIALTS